MTISSMERKARAGLAMARFMQAYMPLAVARWLLKQGTARVRLGFGVTREAVTAENVPCEWIIPRNSPDNRALIYLHGGGFVYGLTPPHLQMAAYLAQKLNTRILMVDYRLAPEHPFPAALDDCLTAYRWLLQRGIPAGNVEMAGDSAGGNLTITALMSLRDRAEPLPAAAACLSPVTDFSNTAIRREGFKDPLLPAKAARFYNKAYVAQHDARDPLISPVYGDLRGLPPLLLFAGEDEMLREDVVRFADLAKSAGADVRLEVYARMWHVWQLNLALPEAQKSLEDIAGFFQVHMGD
jgi:monoterpene epsilon-lactone hydrolase